MQAAALTMPLGQSKLISVSLVAYQYAKFLKKLNQDIH